MSTSLSDWHTAITEWTPDKVSFVLDGNTLGTTTEGIMSLPAHWVLQTETSTGGDVPSPVESCNVYVDKVEAWSRAVKRSN